MNHVAGGGRSPGRGRAEAAGRHHELLDANPPYRESATRQPLVT
jgi:hypothetical protein